jgi:hypothetical protein
MGLDGSGRMCYPPPVADLSEVAKVVEQLEAYYLSNVRPARPLRKT